MKQHPDPCYTLPTSRPGIVSRVSIKVSPAQARAWFLSLADHPERYRFDTHKGFSFSQGRIGEVGARFETEEIFSGLRLRLRFEVVRVTADQFCFVLLAPLSAIWGRFRLTPQGTNQTELQLEVGSSHITRRLILTCPVVRTAIQHQIDRETAHIKGSMEAIYQEETWAS